jgi:hypothetical protein
MKAIASSALIASLLLSTVASAQDASPAALAPAEPGVDEGGPPAEVRSRDGFYLRMSVAGPAFVTFFGDGPTGSASISALDSARGFAIGGSIAPGWVIGGTIQSSTADGTFEAGPLRDATIVNGYTTAPSQRALATLTELGAFIDWYPDPRGGWHVGLSGGLGIVSVENYADDTTIDGFSPAGTVFVGHDWAIGGAWSLGVALVASGATAAKLEHDDENGGDTGYRLAPVSVGLQASLLYF